MPQQVENQEKIKVEELNFLLEVCEIIRKTKSALQEKNFAIAQGALTGIYNGFGRFISNLQYLNNEQKDKLVALNEFIYDSRERLVNQIEVVGQDLETVVKTSHFYERLNFLEGVLRDYVVKWYES